MLDKLRRRLADKQLKLVITDSARERIADEGYDPIYGARPLKRYIQAHIETLIAKTIIADDPAPDTTLTADMDENGFVIR